MGSRMIKKWLLRPLVKKTAIEQRQQVVELCMNEPSLAQQLEQLLTQIGDLERVVGRITLYRATLQDFIALRASLTLVPYIKTLLESYGQHVPLLAIIISHMADFSSLLQLLTASLHDDLSSPWIIKLGFDQHLDHLRDLVEHGNTKIIELEQEEQQKTGIGSLKIRYNKIHGYYIELTNTHANAVPDHYIRQQMLAGRQRFTTVQLQHLQHELFSAKNEIDQVEKQIFDRIKTEVMPYSTGLRKLTHALAHIDGLLSFARLAYGNNYVKPHLNTNRMICIKDGRHPIIELVQQSTFITNDTQLHDQESTWIITGPNMGGKSTYLRQVAHIAIMAHLGSFVPACSAEIALLDRIFTRIGASDNVAEGKSTFLVEMEETAAICSYATHNSLVILDEVGRGTSTFDGLAIAQAVVEYIHTVIKARCLFATHYHELTHLQEQLPGIVSYYAASKKTENGIIFLYKIIRGVADGSFGVEVAKLAQLPLTIVTRSQTILQHLHQENAVGQAIQTIVPATLDKDELIRLSEENQKLKDHLKKLGEIDYDNLSPKKAFDLLWELKNQF
jgi:DNA mismatch repair protein MutS